MNVTQLVTGGIVLGALGVGGYVMEMFFGTVGVILLIAFTVPVIAIVAFLARASGGGGGGTNAVDRRSKGAKQRDD